VGPVAEPQGHYAPRLIGKLVPGVTAVIDDIVVGFEDAIREPVVAHELMGWTPPGGIDVP
jgi:hypothetical protein